MAVAVQVGHARVERGRKLCFRGKRPGLEGAAAIEKYIMVERSRFEVFGCAERGAQHVLERRIGVRGVRARAEAHRRQRGHQLAQRGERGDGAQAVVILCFDHVPAA